MENAKRRRRERSNTLKANQLGMPTGTANGRLRKAVIFYLIQQLRQDICFHCNAKIENLEVLSIEHKRPWRNADTALFWDVTNIAFSHLSCNCSAANRTRASAITAPDGQAWCSGCKEFHPVAVFGKMKQFGRTRTTRCYCNAYRKQQGWEKSKQVLDL